MPLRRLRNDGGLEGDDGGSERALTRLVNTYAYAEAWVESRAEIGYHLQPAAAVLLNLQQGFPCTIQSRQGTYPPSLPLLPFAHSNTSPVVARPNLLPLPSFLSLQLSYPAPPFGS